MLRAESSRKRTFVTESVSLTKESDLEFGLWSCYIELVEIADRGLLGKLEFQLICAESLTEYAESLVYSGISVFSVTEDRGSDMCKVSAYLMSASRVQCDFHKRQWSSQRI